MDEIKVGDKVEYEKRINRSNGFELVMRYGTVTHISEDGSRVYIKPPNKFASIVQKPLSHVRLTTKEQP